MATVFIPSLMQNLTGGQSRVEVEGSTVRQIVESLEKAYPGMKERLVDKHKIKPNISVAIDGEVTPWACLRRSVRVARYTSCPPSEAGPAKKCEPSQGIEQVIRRADAAVRVASALHFPRQDPHPDPDRSADCPRPFLGRVRPVLSRAEGEGGQTSAHACQNRY